MEGRRNGDLGLWSLYRDNTTRGSRSSSSSGYTSAGTIVSISTGYTSNSSRLFSISSLGLEAAIHNMGLELDEDRSGPTKSRKEIETSKSKETKEKKEKMYSYQEIAKEKEEIKILVQEFLSSPSPSPSPSPSVDCSSLKAKGGNIGVLDWWLKHLGVGWVLNIADDYVSAGKLEHTFDHAQSWTRALPKITQAIRFMASLCLGSSAEREQQPEMETETGNKDSIPDLLQFSQFIQETILKLLVFVDVVVEDIMNQRVLRPYNEVNTALISDQCALIIALISVHHALSEALSEIEWLFCSPPSRELKRIRDKIVRILSAKQTKVAEAIWSTMQQIFMDFTFTKDQDNLLCSLDTQASSDVHKATLVVVTYIRLLCTHYWSVLGIVSEAARQGKYVPETGDIIPLDSMIKEIVSCLQETLTNKSEFFLDRGLRFLFLLNNLYFVRQKLPYIPFSLQENMAALFVKVGDDMNSYLQVSWEPMLSSLLDPTPLCFKRNYSPLPKFEDVFRKTYTAQKLWKVPDPELRKTLRNAIIMKIIPSYTKYIEENKISTPRSSPDELKEMLQELFEG